MPGYELGLINEEAGSISTNGYELMSRELISKKTAAKRKQDVSWELTNKKTAIVKRQ